MTDRELLGLAAKAAGIVLEWQEGNWAHCLDTGREWNPLTDDGDALQLAVKLGLNIMQQPDCAEPWVDICGPDVEADELYGADPCAAVRLAITRCAAEIGKGTWRDVLLEREA
jgi:hypothetical protein